MLTYVNLMRVVTIVGHPCCQGYCPPFYVIAIPAVDVDALVGVLHESVRCGGCQCFACLLSRLSRLCSFCNALVSSDAWMRSGTVLGGWSERHMLAIFTTDYYRFASVCALHLTADEATSLRCTCCDKCLQESATGWQLPERVTGRHGRRAPLNQHMNSDMMQRPCY